MQPHSERQRMMTASLVTLACGSRRTTASRPCAGWGPGAVCSECMLYAPTTANTIQICKRAHSR